MNCDNHKHNHITVNVCCQFNQKHTTSSDNLASISVLEFYWVTSSHIIVIRCRTVSETTCDRPGWRYQRGNEWTQRTCCVSRCRARLTASSHSWLHYYTNQHVPPASSAAATIASSFTT